MCRVQNVCTPCASACANSVCRPGGWGEGHEKSKAGEGSAGHLPALSSINYDRIIKKRGLLREDAWRILFKYLPKTALVVGDVMIKQHPLPH